MRRSWLRAIFHALIDELIERYDLLITHIDHFRVIRRLHEYVDAVREEQGGRCPGVGAFIDGKFIATCRPNARVSSDYQRSVYNGYYRGHGKRALHLIFPDGIIVATVGSIRRSDQFLRERDNFEPQVNNLFLPTPAFPHGDPALPLIVWSDTAFAENVHFKRARFGLGVPPFQVAIDESMEAPRKCVEHSFNRVVSLFPLMDCKKKLRQFGANVDKLWKVCVLFTNARTCLGQCQVKFYFKVDAPTIDEYFWHANNNRIV
jgi:hypothetical protein